MKKDIRSKIKQFLTSEAGQVGIRAPLALGVAGGTVLVSQMVHTPSAEAYMECNSSSDCDAGETCKSVCEIYVDGTCVKRGTRCVSS